MVYLHPVTLALAASVLPQLYALSNHFTPRMLILNKLIVPMPALTQQL